MNNELLELLKDSIVNEIANEYVVNDDSIEFRLPNGEIALLTVMSSDEKIYVEQKIARKNGYVFGHDYGDIGENRANKLLLRTLQDVKDYAVDVVQANIIDVTVVGDSVKFANYPTFTIVVETRK